MFLKNKIMMIWKQYLSFNLFWVGKSKKEFIMASKMCVLLSLNLAFYLHNYQVIVSLKGFEIYCLALVPGFYIVNK